MAGGARLTDHATHGRGVPDFLGRPGLSAHHRLNPLTKATLATVTAVAAVVVGGLVGPAILVAVAVVLPAIAAGVLGRLVRTAILLALPIAISALLVNPSSPAARRCCFELVRSLRRSRASVFSLEILARLMAITGAITLFYLTTQL